MRLRGILTRAVARLGLASLVFVVVMLVAPMAASAAPTATINSPASGGIYSVGQNVPTSFSCGDDGSGGFSCTDSNSMTSPGALITSSPGNFPYVVTATNTDATTPTTTS